MTRKYPCGIEIEEGNNDMVTINQRNKKQVQYTITQNWRALLGVMETWSRKITKTSETEHTGNSDRKQLLWTTKRSRQPLGSKRENIRKRKQICLFSLRGETLKTNEQKTIRSIIWNKISERSSSKSSLEGGHLWTPLKQTLHPAAPFDYVPLCHIHRGRSEEGEEVI